MAVPAGRPACSLGIYSQALLGSNKTKFAAGSQAPASTNP